MRVPEYQDMLEKQAKEVYALATKVRQKGYDPKLNVEISEAKDLAARVEELVGPEGVAERVRELLNETQSRNKTALLIIDDIIAGKFGMMTDEKLVVCPECEEPALIRLIGPGAGVIFRGKGFYATDYKKDVSKPKDSEPNTED